MTVPTIVPSQPTRKLTSKQLCERFPKMEPNENCLEDIACPECGNRKSFSITMSSIFTLLDSGTEEYADTEWGPNSYCRCGECEYSAKVRHFTFPGLDNRLREISTPTSEEPAQ